MRIMIPPSQHATRMVPKAQKEPSKGGHLVMLVDCGFGIYRASAPPLPLLRGKRPIGSGPGIFLQKNSRSNHHRPGALAPD